MDEKHQLLRQQLQGREAELQDPKLRAGLVSELSEKTHIHPEFIEGYLEGYIEALQDPDPLPLTERKTRKLPLQGA